MPNGYNLSPLTVINSIIFFSFNWTVGHLFLSSSTHYIRQRLLCAHMHGKTHIELNLLSIFLCNLLTERLKIQWIIHFMTSASQWCNEAQCFFFFYILQILFL